MAIAGLVWIMVVASAESPKRIELRSAAFLMTRGPYAFSRNPMYVSELTLWLGWAMFYGSVGVLVGFVIMLAVLVAAVVPYEERVLAARFGEAYRAYKSVVPRWLGKRRPPGVPNVTLSLVIDHWSRQELRAAYSYSSGGNRRKQ